ncbi:MAG: YbhB/YbcL family Raf kinase inhibitor-like protein [Myxococcales bacterium]|nr:YbhB/YbcL family Raf kinase inhibitor-like protein [Myxococcales bacterium]
MKFWSDSFANGAPIPAKYAVGRPDAKTHVTFADNRNPHFAWTDLPAGTKSLALICHDPDVPSVGDAVNQEGKTVPIDLPRVDFFHWVLVDLHPAATGLAEGALSQGVTAGGKPGPAAPLGARHGRNDYTGWFAGDAKMGGDWYGYDGPCPPWNDARLHHYLFTLYALDVERLPLEGTLDGADVRAALSGHVLGQATWTGTYTLNPSVKAGG